MSETNGAYAVAEPPVPGVQFDLSKLSYGDLRRLQSLDTANGDAQTVVDALLEKVVIGGLDAIPFREVQATVVALMATIQQEMSVSGQPAAPLATGSGAAGREARTP